MARGNVRRLPVRAGTRRLPSLRRPRRLRPGGLIGIAAPAGPVDPARLEAGEDALRGAGFRTRRRDDLLARRGYLAGDDRRRAAELMELVEDPGVDAIVCARGGYGCHRLVSRIDARRVRAAAKPLVGYSDVTTLLLWQRHCAGLVGVHGPMLERPEGVEAGGLAPLLELLAGCVPAPLSGQEGFGGRAEGRLVGGNLVTLVASLGTPWEIQTRDAILVFEEIGERPYRIDRMLQQLLAAGKLSRVAGVAVGHLVECSSGRTPEPGALEVIREVVEPLGVPLVTGLPTGHAAPNRPWALGVRAELDGRRARLAVREPAVVAG